MSTSNQSKPKILLTGLNVHAEITDYFRQLYGTPEEIQTKIDVDAARLQKAGYRHESYQLDDTDPETGLEWLQDRLGKETYGAIMIGSGLRLIPEQCALFEAVVDVCRRCAPTTPILFNNGPGTSCEAVQRRFGKFEE